MFKITTRMVKTNQNITDEHCIRNDGVLIVSDEDKKITWNTYHEKLLNTKFAWDRSSFFLTDTVKGAPRLKEKDMVRNPISKMKGA